MLKRTKTILVLLLLLANYCFAQDNKQDSLLHLLNITKEESVKESIFLQLARINNKKNKEKSVEFYSKALEFTTDSYKKACILDTIGLFNWRLGNFDEAISYYKQSLTIFEELQDSIWIGKVNNNIAVANWGMGNSYDALEHYETALDIRKEINDLRGVSTVLNNIGLIYQSWGLYDNAFEYHEEALEYALQLNSFSAIAYSYSNIALCYENKEEYRTALKFYNLGYENDLKKEKEDHSISYFLANLGRVYSKMGEADSALVYYNGSLEHAVEVNNKHRIAVAQYFLGKTYLDLNNINLAEYYTKSSHQLSIENNYSELIRDNLFRLSEIEEKKGNTSKAFSYFKNASNLKDSIFNRTEIAKFTDLQIRYNIEKQEQENTILRANNRIQEFEIKQQKNISWALLIAGILISGILFHIARSRIKIQKLNIQLEKSEKELRKANADKDKFFTIIAHDLKSPFNGLLGLTRYIETEYDKLDKKNVRELVQLIQKSATGLYSLLDGLLQWAQTQTGRMVYDYKKFDVNISISNVLELKKANAEAKEISLNNNSKEAFVFADEKTIETVLRNLVSNSIKFTNKGGFVTIETEIKETEVVVCVVDNGIGIPEETADKLFTITEKFSGKGTENEIGTGLGLILCQELIKNNKGKIWFESQPNEGSKFYISLPTAK